MTWLEAYRTLAAVTDGVCADDPRRSAVMLALDLCDACYAKRDAAGFRRAAQNVTRLMRGR